MKILIIDNGTRHLRKLKGLIQEAEYFVTDFSEIDLETTDQYDAIILSGGHDFPVIGNEKLLEKEIELIKTYDKPILGICLGFELIARAYCAKLEKLLEREKGIKNIMIIKQDKIFQNINDFKVFESHKWSVKKLPSELIALAESKDGIEALKHINRPLYGVQFHPEMFEDKTCGEKIFKNFIKIAESKWKTASFAK